MLMRGQGRRPGNIVLECLYWGALGHSLWLFMSLTNILLQSAAFGCDLQPSMHTQRYAAV